MNLKKNTQFYTLAFITCFLIMNSQFQQICAQTTLSGDISGMVFDKKNSPYLVEKDVFIKNGEKTVFRAGTIFLFNSFTGINVFGSMFVEGTEDEFVIFTSKNDIGANPDAEDLPKPFDWNGIKIDRTAKEAKFKNVKVKYSVYGIKSSLEKIILINSIFKENGQFHFTINDEILMVEEKISFTYGYNKPVEKKDTTIVYVKNTKSNRPILTSDEKEIRKRKRLATGFGIGTAICGVGTIGFVAGAVIWQQRYMNLEDGNTAKEFKDHKSMISTFATASIGSGILTGINLFVTINQRKKLKSINKKKTKVKISDLSLCINPINLDTEFNIIAEF